MIVTKLIKAEEEEDEGEDKEEARAELGSLG